MIKLLSFCIKHNLMFGEFDNGFCLKLPTSKIDLLEDIKEMINLDNTSGAGVILYKDYMSISIFDSIGLWSLNGDDKNDFLHILEKLEMIID